ncbi:hypothetical protein SH584_10080 [Sphingomonas sp. LY29]|uniref:hypothetical protein n=1 Tax=Sphingomonas sp. LY29 TaxID=3095341 RepID=UPI002D77BA66|nr:hypothetical protein [Sphingomonas sp. LY29]WRP25389.1 hypothetical protein SH584_10080 [Sphingomonas sp. LY29]
MSARGFGSLVWAGAVASAALGFYLVSLRVASERAELESVETKIALAHRDIRLLQTELGTRGRLAQLERWNVKFIRLSAPSADQFVEGGFQLATLAKPEPTPAFDAPVVLASAPAEASRVTPTLGGDDGREGQPIPRADVAPQPSRPVREMVHVASYGSPAKAAPSPRLAPTTEAPRPKAATASPKASTSMPKVDKPVVKKVAATKPIKSATADPLAPLSGASPKAKAAAPATKPASAKSKDSVTD